MTDSLQKFVHSQMREIYTSDRNGIILHPLYVELQQRSPFGLMRNYTVKSHDPDYQYNETYIKWKEVQKSNQNLPKKEK